MRYKVELEKCFRKMLGSDFVGLDLDGTVDHQVFDRLSFVWVNVRTKYSTIRVRLPFKSSEIETPELETAPVEVGV